MRSIRTFAYAAVLTLSMFSFQPQPAAAEEPHGVFKLTHEVHWQNCVLQPGEYSFSLRTSGPPTLLTVRAIDGEGSSAMMLVTDIESLTASEPGKLVLVSRDGESFVSTMDLPEYDMTLRFKVPSASSGK